MHFRYVDTAQRQDTSFSSKARSVTPRAALAVLLTTASGWADLSKAKAAEAMQCPETELVETPIPPQDDEGAKMFAALMLLPVVATVGGAGRRRIVNRVVPSGGAESRWAGCGRTFDCDSEGCGETARSRTSRLMKAVPTLMEKARAQLGTDATAEQVGYFTWDIFSSRGPTHCRVVTEEVFHCSPDLGEATAPAAPLVVSGAPSAPPAPPRVEPQRAPLVPKSK